MGEGYLKKSLFPLTSDIYSCNSQLHFRANLMYFMAVLMLDSMAVLVILM